MITFAIILASCLTLLGYSWGSRARDRRRRALPRPEVGPIAALPAGRFTRVRGVVVPMGEVLTAPLTGRPCVSYVVLAAIQGTPTATVIARRSAGVQFGVDDGSGKALVEMDGTKITLAVDHAETITRGKPLSRPAIAFLSASGIERIPADLVLNEAILAPGTTIEVSGSAHPRPDPNAISESGYRDSVATRMHFEKPDA